MLPKGAFIYYVIKILKIWPPPPPSSSSAIILAPPPQKKGEYETKPALEFLLSVEVCATSYGARPHDV